MVEVGVCLGGRATDGDLYKREAGGQCEWRGDDTGLCLCLRSYVLSNNSLSPTSKVYKHSTVHHLSLLLPHLSIQLLSYRCYTETP